MPTFNPLSPFAPDAPIGETLLVETAIRIELPPSQHKTAVDRYEAVRKYIEREGSPLHGKVALFYPQGSMAIGATIKSYRRAEGYDIDIIAELLLPYSMAPAQVLDLLYKAIRGEPGSRYYKMVKRQTRCVTIEYEDGMHLDVTPTILLDTNDPRKSHIFHAKEGTPPTEHKKLPINTYAFIEWFNGRTPIDMTFSKAFSDRAWAFDKAYFAEAPAQPVPDHSTEQGGKSATVVAMQLIKRHRNMRYLGRNGRMPPSVMLACFAGRVAYPGNSISEAISEIVGLMLKELGQAQSQGQLIQVINPKCEEECFTDRWPETLQAQRLYIDELKIFQRQLGMLMDPGQSLQTKQQILGEMFGETIAKSIVDGYSDILAKAVQSGNRQHSTTGRVLTGSMVSAPNIIKPAAAHTFYGTSWRNK